MTHRLNDTADRMTDRTLEWQTDGAIDRTIEQQTECQTEWQRMKDGQNNR